MCRGKDDMIGGIKDHNLRFKMGATTRDREEVEGLLLPSMMESLCNGQGENNHIVELGF